MKKPSRKTLIKKLDDLARQICFHRDQKTCVRCGRKAPYVVQWSHVLSRKNKALRWEPENHLTLCFLCHKEFWHDNPTESGEWFRTTYPDRYEFLQKHQMDILKTDAYHLELKYEALKQLAINLGVI